MSTELQSFDRSQLGVFVRSELGVRNRISVGLFDFAVILVTSGTRKYHPFTYAIQQTGFCVDARSNIGIGAELAHRAWENDLPRFRIAKTQLETLGNVLVGVVYVAVKYDWRNLESFTGDPEQNCFGNLVDHASNSARIGLKPPSVTMPSDVEVVRHDNVEGYTIGGFENIVSSLSGATRLADFTSMRVGSSGIVIPLAEHIYDSAGDYITLTELSVDEALPPNLGYPHPAWIRDVQRRGLPGQFLAIGDTAGNWLIGATAAMESMHREFRP